ncbi:FtsX-like permease family protein [Kineosporia sp. J2-2]|uniref:FtsX-like permease family protein n=1 Tax=Kineosporia corallincola TaxID=2835133 RepID=A0ABS5T8L9_9ACTN|nr:FtsX-like permease family protein [Kineosporia corallincola]MBT0767418.1 FtsX-like permease family protein [Kineosporia corallincola]
MLYLAGQMARRRIAALIAVLSAVIGGAVLITTTGVLAESGLRSHPPVTRLTGADVLVGASQTFTGTGDLPVALPERAVLPADSVAGLTELPGVETVVGDISFPAAVLTADGQPVATATDPAGAGHGWSSSSMTEGTAQGQAPTGDAQVALGRAFGLRIGDTVQVVADGVPHRVTVTALVGTDDAGIYFADARAAELSGDAAKVDLIAVKVADGHAASVADRIRSSHPDLEVATGDARGDVLDPPIGAARSLLSALSGSMAGITLLLVGFIVAGALGVSIEGQRRELALLRAVGATPLQIRRLAAGQATVAVVVALVPGIALGYLLAGQARRLLVHLDLLPAGLPLAISPLPAVGTALLLLVTVQIAARCAAWRVSRRPATEAVAESRTEAPATGRGARIRNGAGLLLIFAGTLMSVTPLVSRSVLAISSSALAGIIAAVGLALAGPTQLGLLSGRLSRTLPSRVSPTGWLAVSNVHGYARRFAGAVTTLAMAVVFVLTYAFTQTSLMQAQRDDTTTGTTAQYGISAPGLGGVPAGTLSGVKAVDGVRGAAEIRNTTVLWKHLMLGDVEVEPQAATVAGPDAAGVLDLGITDGSLAALHGSTVAVGASTGLEVGDEATLYLGDGTPATAEVVAVYDRDLGFGTFVASPDLVAGHLTNALASTVLVRTENADALYGFVQDRPGLVLGGTATTASGPKGVPADVWINLAAIGVLLGYLLLGITNKLVAATAARRAEFATLRLNGSTVRQIRSMTRREAGLITLAATVTGLLLAATPMVLLGLGLLGRPWPAGPVWLVPATIGVVVLIGFTSIELATRQALRLPPAEALAQRE